MSDFNNVRIIKKPNIYFEGKVFSYSLLFEDGSKKTLGVMQIGEYELLALNEVKKVNILVIFQNYQFSREN